MKETWLDLVWNIFVWGGFGYLIFFHGASGWWFLMAILLTADFSGK